LAGPSDCWSLKSLNALAAKIIDARYEGHEIEEVMEAEFPPAEFGQTWSRGRAPVARTSQRLGWMTTMMPSTPSAMQDHAAA
jgi:hypothetical protein